MSCLKTVVAINCKYCQGEIIKFGKTGVSQRYRCKNCKRTQLKDYVNQACKTCTNSEIASHVKEGCGIRSIARLLNISVNTVISRIQKIANSIKKPIISIGKVYEVDELKTYIKNKNK